MPSTDITFCADASICAMSATCRRARPPKNLIVSWVNFASETSDHDCDGYLFVREIMTEDGDQ